MSTLGLYLATSTENPVHSALGVLFFLLNLEVVPEWSNHLKRSVVIKASPIPLCYPFLHTTCNASLGAPASLGFAGRSEENMRTTPAESIPAECHLEYPSQKSCSETCTMSPSRIAIRESGKRKILSEHVATVLLRTKGKLHRSRTKFKIVLKLKLYGIT